MKIKFRCNDNKSLDVMRIKLRYNRNWNFNKIRIKLGWEGNVDKIKLVSGIISKS